MGAAMVVLAEKSRSLALDAFAEFMDASPMYVTTPKALFRRWRREHLALPPRERKAAERAAEKWLQENA